MKSNTRKNASRKNAKKLASKKLGKNKTKKRVFSKKDYGAGDGMVTKIWGPSMWHVLHTMSFNYPVEPTQKDKKHYRDFVWNLQYVLPCKHCRMNLKTNFKELPITIETMKNRETFSKYIYQLHELINKMLQKKSGLTYCDVRERYEHFRSRCTENEKPKLFTLKQLHTINKSKKNGSKKEKGCTEPLYGKKSKCILKIVPQEVKCESFQMEKECMKRRD